MPMEQPKINTTTFENMSQEEITSRRNTLLEELKDIRPLLVKLRKETDSANTPEERASSEFWLQKKTNRLEEIEKELDAIQEELVRRTQQKPKSPYNEPGNGFDRFSKRNAR